MTAPEDKPRDWRWSGAPDLDTGAVPLAPTAAADDPRALLAEAAAWCADTTRALRAGLVADLAEALRRAAELHKIDAFMVHAADRARDEARRDQFAAEAERDNARRDRDRLARRLDAVGAIARGARFRLDPDADDAPGPDGRAAR